LVFHFQDDTQPDHSLPFWAYCWTSRRPVLLCPRGMYFKHCGWWRHYHKWKGLLAPLQEYIRYQSWSNSSLFQASLIKWHEFQTACGSHSFPKEIIASSFMTAKIWAMKVVKVRKVNFYLESSFQTLNLQNVSAENKNVRFQILYVLSRESAMERV